MTAVAERILDGDLVPRADACRIGRARATSPMQAPAARRQLADLPGVLRPADRHGDGVAARSPTRCSASRRCSSTCSGTTSPTASWSPSTGPSRRSATRPIADVQGQPRRGARHPAPADGPRAPGASRRCGIPIVELAGFEADDIIATLADRRPRRAATTSSSSPATATRYQLVEDPHVKVLYNRRGVSRLRALRRGRHRRAHRRHARRSTRSTPRCAATRPTTCPACPGVGEKTAAKLITTYGGLDGIFANLDEQTPKLRAEPRPSTRRGCAQNAEVMVLRRDVAARASTSTTLARRARSTPTRSSGCSTSSSSARCYDRLAEALGDADRGRAVGVERRGARGRGRRGRRRRPTRPRCSSAAPASTAARRRRRVGGEPGRSAARRAGRRRRRRRRPRSPGSRRRCSPTPTCAPRSPRSSADGRPLRRPPRQGADARRCSATASTSRALALDTAIAAYLLDPAEARYALGRPARALHARSRCPTRRRRADGQLDLDGDGDDRRRSAPAARRSPSTALAGRCVAALDAQGMRELYDDIENPLVGVLARMEHVGIAVDVAELEALNDRLTAEVRARSAPSCDGGRPASSTSTRTPQLREILFDERGLAPQKKTKTGLLHRRRDAREARGTSTRSSSTLLRYREVEKLRGTYGEGLLAEVGARRSHPRHVQPDRGPHRPAQLATSRTCTTSRCAARRAGSSARRSCRRRAASCSSPTTTRSSCAASPTSPRTRASIAAFTSGPGHPHRHRVAGVRGRARRRSRSSSGRRRRWCRYGLAYGMEAYGLGQRLNIPTEEAAEILDAYFVAFPNVKAYMDRTVVEARERGYTETLFGRRRPIPELARLELPHPPGRGAPGDERRHPGPGRRHLQGGAGAPRPARSRTAGSPAGSSCRCTTRCCRGRPRSRARS